MSSDLCQFLADKSLLITGGTGFVGKCLLEKILRECPHVKAVYLLLRPKSGQTVEKRLKELLANPIFDSIRATNASTLERVIAVCGDVTLDELGLNPMDRHVIRDSVSIVFNCAATIRFDEPLRRALQLNVLSAQRVLRLVESLARIDALVHVSTAYCTRDRDDVTESVDKEGVSLDQLLSAAEWLDESVFEASVRKQFFGQRMSSYHFTKALAENVFLASDRQMPLAIVRPSIICAAWREPSAGWVDNYNGLSGYLVAAGKGVLRTLHAHPRKLCDIIPVDIVVNTCLASAYHVTTRPPAEWPLVVNCVSGALNPITWSEIKAISEPLLVRHPSQELFRFPGVSFHSHAFLHSFHLFLEHRIPALVVDLLFRACGLQPILGKVYQKVNKSVSALQYFTCNEWRFRCEQQRRLADSLSPRDAQLFPCDVRRVQWKRYFEDYILGIREHLLREKSDTLPAARLKLRRLWILTQITKSFLFFVSFYAFLRIFLKRTRFLPKGVTNGLKLD